MTNAPGDQRFHNEDDYRCSSELLDRNDDFRDDNEGDVDEVGRKWEQLEEKKKKSGNAGGRKRSTA